MILLLGLSLVIAFVSSCAGIKSGHYVKMRPGESLSSMAKEFDVPLWAMEEANQGKKLAAGDWVYVPLHRGFMEVVKERTPASLQRYFDSSNDFLWPVPASKKITSGFGMRWGRIHEGIDIGAKRGTYFVASNDGIVVYSGAEYGGYGNLIIMAHHYGFFSLYAHAQKSYVKVGQAVYRGQVIGRVGSTGRSTGPHLHFEVRRDGRAIDPMVFLTEKRNSRYASNHE